MPLRIDDLSIEQLSGPKIVVLAIPKSKYRKTIPVFLLFGEEHVKTTNPCNELDMKEQFEEIFEKLDEIAEEKEIHFFAEWFFDKRHIEKITQQTEAVENLSLLPFSSGLESEEEIKLENFDIDSLPPPDFLFNEKDSKGSKSDLMKILLDEKAYCYFNEFKKGNPRKFIEMCPYPNIIWQFSDIRHDSEKTDDIFQNIALFDGIVSGLIEFLLNCSKSGEIHATSKDGPGKKFYRTMWNNMCSNTYQKFKTRLDSLELYDDRTEVLIKKLNNDDIIKALKYLFDFYGGKFDKITNNIMNIHRIQKQLNKLTKKIIGQSVRVGKYKTTMSKRKVNKNKTFITNVKLQINNYLSRISRIWNLRLKEDIELYFPLLKLIFEFLKEGKEETKFQEIMEYVNTYYEELNPKNFLMFIQPLSSILDIYLLLRSFKYRKAKLVSALIGIHHILHLIEFFKSNKDLYRLYCFDSIDNSYKATLEYYQGNLNVGEFTSECIDMNKAYNQDDELIDFDKNIMDYI